MGILEDMERDPEFAGFSYPQQVQARALAFSDVASKDPGWVEIPDPDKEAMIQAYAMRPPVFRNPDVGVLAAGLAEELKKDPTGGSFRAFVEAFSEDNPLYRAWERWSVLVPQVFGMERDAASQQAELDSLYGEDGAKFREWFASASPDHGVARFIGGAGKVASNLLALKGLPWMNAARTSAAGLVENIAAGTTIRSQAVRGILGNFAQNTLDAVGLTASEMLGKVWDKGADEWNLETVAKSYGENALMDYAIGTVAGVVWPFVKIAGKSFAETWLPRGKSSITKTVFSSEDLDKYISQAVTGELPEELTQRLPGFYADQARALEYMQDLQTSTKKSRVLLNESPFFRASVTAKMAGKELGVGADGFPVLRNLDDIMGGLDKPVSFRSLADANEEIVDTLAEIIEKHPRKFKLEDYGPQAPLIKASLERRAALRGIPETKGVSSPVGRGFLTQNEAGFVLGSSGAGAALVRVTPGDLGVGVVGDLGGDHVSLLRRVANPEETLTAFRAAQAQKTQNPLIRESVRDRGVDALRRAGFDGASFPDGRIVALYKGSVLPVRESGFQPGLGKGAASESEAGLDAFIQVETTKLYKDSELGRDPRKAARLISGRGVLGKERLGKYVQEVLGASGASDVKVKIETGPEIKALEASLDETGRVLGVRMPEDIPIGGRREALRTLTRELKKASPGVKEPVAYARLAARQTRGLEIPGTTFEARKTWVTHNLEKLGGTRVRDLGGGRIGYGGREFGSLEDAADYLVASRLTPDALRVSLAEEGMRLRGVRGRLEVTDARGKILARGASVPEVLGNLGWRPGKIPSEMMPEVAVVEGGARFSYTKGVVKGSYPELLRYLDRFENFKLEEGKRILDRMPDAIAYKLPERGFEVVIPGAGVREAFQSPKEARWFLKGGWAEYEGVRRVLKRRGIPFRIRDGVYEAEIGGEVLRAGLGDKDALTKILKRAPDPQTLPSLIGEEAETMLEKAGVRMPRLGPLDIPSSPPAMEVSRKVSPLALASKLYPTPLTRWIENSLKKTSHPEVLRDFDELVDRFRVFSAEHSKWRRLISEAISPGGKTLSDEKLRGLRWWLEASSEEARDGIVAEFKLSQADLAAGERIRDILGRNEGDGLFGLFGIDPFKFVNDYVPRIRRAMDDMRAKGVELEPENIFRAAFPAGPPKEIKFFAEMDRLSEILTFDAEDNIGVILDRYVTQGLKKHYLNPSWRKLDASLRQARSSGIMDERVTLAVNQWRDIAMGYKTPGEKELEAFTGRFMEKLGVGNPGFTKDLTKVLFTAQAFGTMAWKGWNVVRNIAQIYTTFGSTYGHSLAARAMKETADNSVVLISRAKRLGVLLDTPPLINSIIDERGLAGRIVHKGLAAFKATDDYTRVAALRGGDIVFDDALGKLRSGVLKDGKDFIRYSKAYRFSEGAQAQIMDLVGSGRYEGARDLFSRLVVEDTMFAYDKIHNPILFNGLLGRFIGQYGVYAVQYIQNVRKGLTLGPVADRLAYAARLAGVSAAFLGVARELGIDAEQDFLPWAPAQFTGGPMFNLVSDLWQSVGTGFVADQARARIKTWLPVGWEYQDGEFKFTGARIPGGPAGSFIPFGAQFRALNKAAKHLEAGENWLAWLALTSTPIQDELRR